MTKRPFAYIGIPMLCTFAAVFYLDFYGFVFALVTAAALAAGAFLILKKGKKSALLLISAAIAVCAVYSSLYSSWFFSDVSANDGALATVKAVSVGEGRLNYDSYGYELKTTEIGGEKVERKLLLKSFFDLDIDYGDSVSFKAEIKKCDNNYYLSKGYSYYAVPGDDFDLRVDKADEKGLGYFPVYVRQKLTHAVSVLVPGLEGELCNALALGDKFGMSKQLYTNFSESGLSYIIVVSGMHMSILASFLLFILRPLRRRNSLNMIRYILTVCMILFYMAVTGFSSSAVRSGIMIIIVLLHYAAGRDADVYNSMGVAAIVLSLFNPFAVGDVGLLMSFSAVLGIVSLTPRMKAFYDRHITSGNCVKRFLRYMYLTICVSVSAVIAVSPITMAFFSEYNPFVILSSLLITVPVMILLAMVLMISVLYYLGPLSVFAYALAFVARIIAGYVILVVNVFSDPPFDSFYGEPEHMLVWVICAALIITLCMLLKNRRKAVSIGIFASVCLYALSYCGGLLLTSDSVTLDVFGCPNGSTVLLSGGDKHCVLCCGGGNTYRTQTAEKVLRKTRELNYLLVPSTRPSDSGYASQFLETFDVLSVMMYYKYNTNERAYRYAVNNDSYGEFHVGDSFRVELCDGVEDYVFNVRNHTWQYINSENLSVLIAPDNGKEWELPEKCRDPDILIANTEFVGIDTVNYKTLIWTSSKDTTLDCVRTEDGDVEIEMR